MLWGFWIIYDDAVNKLLLDAVKTFPITNQNNFSISIETNAKITAASLRFIEENGQ